MHSITRSALTIVLRLEDRLAHYLLHRAYFGLNARAASDTQPAVDAHSIQFNFPEPIRSESSELIRSVVGGQPYGAVLDDFNEAPPAEGREGLILTLPLADRWLADFTRGLQLSDGGATLPSQMLTHKAKVRLCTIVQRVCAQIREGTYLYSGKHTDTILWQTIEYNLPILPRFFPVSWVVDATGLDSPLQLSCASTESDTLAHDTYFVEPAFHSATQAQSALNSSSWYFDESSLQSVARRAARGTLSEADINRQLRECHLRSLRFLGVSSMPDIIPWYNTFPETRPSHLFVVAELIDANSVVWPLFVCVLPGPPVYASYAVLLRPSLGTLPWIASAGSAETLTVSPQQMRQNCAGGAGFIPHGLEVHLEKTKQLKAQQEAHTEECVSTINSEVDAAASPSLVSGVRTAAATMALVMSQTEQSIADTHVRAQVKAALEAITRVAQFSLFGTTLYSHNHPLSVRRRFTSFVLDESMLAAGVTPLPKVLIDLVAQYAPVDALPFVEELAKAQMKNSGAALRDPAEALYAGQLDHAVERPSADINAAANDKWPVQIPPLLPGQMPVDENGEQLFAEGDFEGEFEGDDEFLADEEAADEDAADEDVDAEH